jgi:hypothetical protein
LETIFGKKHGKLSYGRSFSPKHFPCIEDNHGNIFGIWVPEIVRVEEETPIVVKGKSEKTI